MRKMNEFYFFIEFWMETSISYFDDGFPNLLFIIAYLR